MDSEMNGMTEDEIMGETEEYQGIEFTPPEGTVHPSEKEGDALVRWKKIGDKYTLIEFEGKPVAQERIPPTKEEVEAKKDQMKRMTAFQELDQLAQL